MRRRARSDALSPSVGPGRRNVTAVLLCAVAVLAHARAVGNGFTYYDDPQYITSNPAVLSGLSCKGAIWAFTSTHAANWHPLTWLSHMLDITLFGTAPWGHHLVSVMLHGANTALLFLALSRMIGARIPCAAAVALFALHPLHVESVAWASERKDVLSTLFFLLALSAYIRYVRRPGAGRYLPVAGLFALGLLAKPMVLTLPLLLLLLDWWPLGRIRRGRPWALLRGPLLEKLPLLGLSAASALVTYLAQHASGATSLTFQFPLWVRAENALLSYVRYLGKAIWPTRLIPFYPHPGRSISEIAVVFAGLFLAGLTVVFVLRRRKPYLIVGWLWYLVALLPVIGLIQVGRQAMADRYTYLPLVGIFLAASMFVADLARRLEPPRRSLLTAGFLAVLTVLAMLTWKQTGYWRTTISLFGRVIERDMRNMIAHNMVGVALLQSGHVERALGHFGEAVALDADYSDARYNLGLALERMGLTSEARTEFERVLSDNPSDAEVRFVMARLALRENDLDGAETQLRAAMDAGTGRAIVVGELAGVLAARGRDGEARDLYREAIEADPDDGGLRQRFGILLAESGDLPAAIEQLRAAAGISPDSSAILHDLGRALDLAGRRAEAAGAYREALSLRPSFPEALNNLGALLAGDGRLSEAAALFREALRLRPGYAEARSNLERIEAP